MAIYSEYDDDDHSLHERILGNILRSIDNCWYYRQEAKADRRFCDIAGAMWEGFWGDQLKNSPMMEINKGVGAVNSIISDYRRNRISASFVPSDGSEEDDLADALTSLFRSTQQTGLGRMSYSNGFEEGVKGGMGGWRLRAIEEDDEDPDNERQKLILEPIYDADICLFFDDNAQRQDKSDAKWGACLYAKTRTAYIKEFGEDIVPIPTTFTMGCPFDWITKDIIYIAEYYEIEKHSETLNIYHNKYGQEEKIFISDLTDEKEEELSFSGYKFNRKRRIKRTRVHKYLLDGDKILKDEGYIAGKHIPLIPYYCRWSYIDAQERFSGEIRLIKDSQRIYNIGVSKFAQYMTYPLISKPIFDPAELPTPQLREMWSSDNIENNAFLFKIDPVDIQGNKQKQTVQYTKTPEIPGILGTMLQISNQDIQELQGSQMEAQKMRSHISGEAISLIQERVDAKSELPMSNMEVSARRTAEIWLEMAKEVYVEYGRTVKGLSNENEPQQIKLMQPSINPDTGELDYKNDISKAKHEVIIEIGPTSISQRKATLTSINDLLPKITDPELSVMLQVVALMNLEAEGVGQIRKAARKRGVMMGIIEPNEQEKQMMQDQAQQAQQPTAEDIYLQSVSKESDSKTAKNTADIELIAANTQLAYAKAKKEQVGALDIMFGNKQSKD